MNGHEHCAASCCSECLERLRDTKPNPPMSVKERVVEAAKAWNSYEGDSPDEYARLASVLHLAVDALEAKP